MGIAVKPAVGMFDFASRTTEGIKNQTRSDILSMNPQVNGTIAIAAGVDHHLHTCR